MKELKRAVMWMALVVIVLLTVLSIYGAFIGTERSQAFFNSVPLAVYWFFFALLLIVSLFLFPRLIRVPGMLLVHLGCIAILTGGLWGSDAGHRFQKNLLGREKLASGTIIVYEGLSENRIVNNEINPAYAVDPNNNVIIYEFDAHGHPLILTDDDPRILHLPFEIHLKDFHMEYYDPPRLLVDTADGKSWELKPLEADASFQLDGAASLEYATAKSILNPGGEYLLLELKGRLWLFATAALSRVFSSRTMRTYLASPSSERCQALKDLFDSGTLHMTVSRRFPLEQAGEALAMLKEGHAKGKIVIEIP